MYAKDTSVSVEKSRSEIESLLRKYGATGFVTGWQGSHSMIAFDIHNLRVRFMLPLPDRKDQRFWLTPSKKHKRSEADAHREWEQACRSRWRALLLCIKAKLEAVEVGITTFEEEFLAHIVMPGGDTVGQTFIPRLPEVMAGSPLPLLLPAPPAN